MNEYIELIVALVGILQPVVLFVLGSIFSRLTSIEERINRNHLQVVGDYCTTAQHNDLRKTVHRIGGEVQALRTVEELRRAGVLIQQPREESGD